MSLLRILKRPGSRGVLLGLGCAIVAWLAAHYALLLNLEEWLQDGCFTFRGQRSTRARILIVGLDEKSFDALKKPLLYTSPEFAEVVTYFKTRGVAAIGMDVFHPESYTGLPDLQAGKPGDVTLLGKAIQDAGNVVLPEWTVSRQRLRPVMQWQLKHLTDPGPADFGFVNATEDDDFFLRRQQLFVRDSDGVGQPCFGLALAAMARGWKIDWTDEGLFLQGDRVPLDEEQKLRINFVGPPGTFEVLPLIEVLAAARGDQGLPGDVDPRGAIVIIGITAQTQHDYLPTPFSNTYWGNFTGKRAGLMAGSEVQANIAATLLDSAYVVTPPWPVHLLILLVVGAAMGRVFARLKLGGGLALALAHHFAWKFICLGLFAWLSLRLQILPMLILGGLLYGVTFLQRWWTLRRMVGVVNAESVARLLEDDPASLDRGGEDRVVTVLFADIRSFSTFSESHSAREVVGLLNAYFTAIVPVVERHGGTLNQYMGDGIMVIFGSPVARDDHAVCAVRAAVEMVRLVAELQERWAQLDFPGLGIGVGINTGRAVIGMVGSPSRQDYTAIGDTTNTAARIESKTRQLDADILISRSAYLDVPRADRVALGCDPQSQAVEVKGKSQKVEVHAVRVRPATISPGGAPTVQAKEHGGTTAPQVGGAGRATQAAEPSTVTGVRPAVDRVPASIGRYRVLDEL
jgi:adenylate cyclase